MIPRAAHFVFGLRDEPEELHLVHELAVVSCLEVVQPDEVHLHCHHEPFGPHWERIKSRVTLHHVERVAAVDALHYTDASVAHYSYAHHADIVRLEVLAEHGGLYADLDTLFIAPLPDDLWRHPFVIGREADVFVASGDALRPALSNALMLSVPGSRFVETWRSEVEGALDGSWVGHSSFLAYDLARRLPRERHVAPQRMFHAFEPSIAGIAMLLEHPPPDLQGVVSLHLNSHLWWEERRIDMSTVHAAMIDEAWIASSPSTYAACARAITAGAPPGC